VSGIVDRLMEPGDYSIAWSGTDENGRQLSAGVYFLRTEYEQESIKTKLIPVAD
jgi:hypothetical protein